MTHHSVTILDRNHDAVATATVERVGDRFSGDLDPRSLSEDLRRTFTEFEMFVNDQVFSRLDPIEERIESLALVARFADGSEATLSDIQIFHSARTISFRLAAPVVSTQGR
jgi:hypothetical protein